LRAFAPREQNRYRLLRRDREAWRGAASSALQAQAQVEDALIGVTEC
jgi:hypothetical protein